MLRTYVWSTWKSRQENLSTTGISITLLGVPDAPSHLKRTCVLLGQPTLRRRLRLGTFAALDQRIALRYHIDGMDLVESAAYVTHHLALPGRADPLFSDDATAL